ncbi:hypothetical protein VTN77DRAFT_4600 [Rasamsonia byssochlamydoides]|uniref:uncharacterized protein n=1 Tax=Rasamsonia byssochlamydoides TaxID=89139 RepID=UPI0037432A99
MAHYQPGAIHWYGTRNYSNNRMLSEVLNFKNGIDGQLLATHPLDSLQENRVSSFGINAASIMLPTDLEVGSIYTLYGLWNTTNAYEGNIMVISNKG